MADSTIKVGHLKITDHLILGIADARNKSGEESFRKFNLETKCFLGWNQITEAMKDKSIDVAFMLAPAAMDLYNSGVDMSLTLFAHRTGSVFVKNKAANIERNTDLKGKIIAIPYQLSVHHMLLHKLLTEAGLEPGAGKDVSLEVMAPSQMPQAIQYDDVGEMAGFIVAEPFGTQAVNEGYAEEFHLSKDLWPNHPCCVVVVRQDVIESNSDAIFELTKGLVDASKLIESDIDKVVGIGTGFLGQDQAVVRKVLTEPSDRVLYNNLSPSVDDLADIQDYMHDKMNLLKNKIDLEKFIDASFSKAANA
ncbi:MAG: ABC transporter substrate-binding protein [Proteobacteria bacterium]|nr:ABC transporter substrate-binding protein [Pseudomonadota bacterium]